MSQIEMKTPTFALEQFDFIKPLGSGAFGVTSLYRHVETKAEYAIKVIKKPLPEDENEIRILETMNHPHVIRYFGNFKHRRALYIMMEYCDGGTLQDFICRQPDLISEQLIKEIFAQLVTAIYYLHSRNIVHRDLKPANIFFNKKRGFGISDVGSELTEFVGTPAFLAPEFYQRKAYDYKVDIFALGCILYQLMSLEVPFTRENEPNDRKSIEKRALKGEIGKVPAKYLNSELHQLMKRMIDHDPAKRPSTDQIFEMDTEFAVFLQSCKQQVVFEQGHRRIRAKFAAGASRKLPIRIPQNIHATAFTPKERISLLYK